MELDVLVGSADDDGSAMPGDLDPPPRLVVATDGERGGWARRRAVPGRPLPGALVDTYGAGDSFAAGLTYALAAAEALDEALAFAAE